MLELAGKLLRCLDAAKTALLEEVLGHLCLLYRSVVVCGIAIITCLSSIASLSSLSSFSLHVCTRAHCPIGRGVLCGIGSSSSIRCSLHLLALCHCWFLVSWCWGLSLSVRVSVAIVEYGRLMGGLLRARDSEALGSRDIHVTRTFPPL